MGEHQMTDSLYRQLNHTRIDLLAELEAADLAADTRLCNYLQIKLELIDVRIENEELRMKIGGLEHRMKLLERVVLVTPKD